MKNIILTGASDGLGKSFAKLCIKNNINIIALCRTKPDYACDFIETDLRDESSIRSACEIIKNNYPWVRLIESDENLGFGKAHNLVIRNIKSKYHIIVNPDILLPTDTIEKAVEFMEENKDIVVMTPFVLNTDGTQQFLPKKNPSMKYMIGGFFEKYSSYCRELRDEYTLKNEKSIFHRIHQLFLRNLSYKT